MNNKILPWLFLGLHAQSGRFEEVTGKHNPRLEEIKDQTQANKNRQAAIFPLLLYHML